MLGVYTIVEASPLRVGLGAHARLRRGGASAAGRVRASPGARANPLVPLRVFRSRTVTAANLIQVLMVAGLFGMFFLGALYMQRVLGYDAIEVGLAFLPGRARDRAMSLGFSARLITRFGGRADADAGARARRRRAAAVPQRPGARSYVTDLFPRWCSMGVGAGLAFPSLMTLAMSAATPKTPDLHRGWSTRPSRSAARSGSRCSRRSRRLTRTR